MAKKYVGFKGSGMNKHYSRKTLSKRDRKFAHALAKGFLQKMGFRTDFIDYI